ncbi:ESX secretion-associated protein EspG [Rhodococcus sp. IEGM 1379]|uniref:ESX secretion-associated protein EspG n=1 Tax=Rhodococcus sp. IEGM 1379 TaxID=3047086 RepID=UPI0024B7878B|nr:ESX secretion-associated protein EspG [Rhodococcus sp. IEGM 1379]MDI9917007.1 ESX secretion-associated protein EspG [Rhodococcus sp. IEGM 1379]
MSLSQWQFSGLEFQLLWDAVGRDRLPHPLRFHPHAETMTDLTQQRQHASERLIAVLDERLHRALEALVEPNVRVEVCGLTGQDVTRAHGVVVGGIGVLAVQLPGRQIDIGSDVTLSVGRASELPRMIVGALPQCAAGTGRWISVRQPSNLPGHRIMNSAGDPRVAEELKRFFGRPRTSVGEIATYPGIAVDARPTDDGIAFHWCDYAADGRYIVENGETISARAASGADIVEQISSGIAEVARRVVPARW